MAVEEKGTEQPLRAKLVIDGRINEEVYRPAIFAVNGALARARKCARDGDTLAAIRRAVTAFSAVTSTLERDLKSGVRPSCRGRVFMGRSDYFVFVIDTDENPLPAKRQEEIERCTILYRSFEGELDVVKARMFEIIAGESASGRQIKVELMMINQASNELVGKA